MDEPETTDGAASLIALKRADEVPLNRYIARCLLLLKRLLNPILADILEPRCYCCSDCFRAVSLGHANNAHVMPPPPGCLAARHSIAYKGQPVRQAWESHNLLIYWRMVRY